MSIIEEIQDKIANPQREREFPRRVTAPTVRGY